MSRSCRSLEAVRGGGGASLGDGLGGGVGLEEVFGLGLGLEEVFRLGLGFRLGSEVVFVFGS